MNSRKASAFADAFLLLPINFYFLLNTANQIAGVHIKCQGDPPQSLEVWLLASVFDHRQMRACNSRKSAQHILRKPFFISQLPNRLPNGFIPKLHTTTPLTLAIAYSVLKRDVFIVYYRRHAVNSML